MRGHVRLDGVLADTASRRVRAGQQLTLELVPTDESRAFTPQPMALAVLYEDEHLLVLDKPAGLVVHPAPGNWSGTLLNGLLAHHAAAATLPRAGIVHRLDKDTSGVMMVGKTLPAVTALVRDIAARDGAPRYLALVHGAVGQRRRSRSRRRSAATRACACAWPWCRSLPAGGRRAPTCARLAVHATAAIPSARCVARCTPGARTRSACTWPRCGHPLVADALYGGRPALGMQRQALHASRAAPGAPGHARRRWPSSASRRPTSPRLGTGAAALPAGAG